MASINQLGIYGIRIPTDNIKYYLEFVLKYSTNNIYYSDSESWNLQILAKLYNVHFVVVHREYHDGDTDDVEQRLENCPVYVIANKDCILEQDSFDLIELSKLSQSSLITTNLIGLFSQFNLDINDIDSRLYLDYVDMDMKIEIHNPDEN